MSGPSGGDAARAQVRRDACQVDACSRAQPTTGQTITEICRNLGVAAREVFDVLNRLPRPHRKPAVMQVNNGTVFASRAPGMLTPREFAELGQRNAGC